MARPNLSAQRREELLPEICHVFIEYGYRRTTTAILANACDVRENVLYRLWPNKKEMFLAAIAYRFEKSSLEWQAIIDAAETSQAATLDILKYESQQRGSTGFYRIIFSALNETDDPDFKSAVKEMYQNFHKVICKQIKAYRQEARVTSFLQDQLTAWAIIGIATITDISREIELLGATQRKNLLYQAGLTLLESPETEEKK